MFYKCEETYNANDLENDRLLFYYMGNSKL